MIDLAHCFYIIAVSQCRANWCLVAEWNPTAAKSPRAVWRQEMHFICHSILNLGDNSTSMCKSARTEAQDKRLLQSAYRSWELRLVLCIRQDLMVIAGSINQSRVSGGTVGEISPGYVTLNMHMRTATFAPNVTQVRLYPKREWNNNSFTFICLVWCHCLMSRDICFVRFKMQNCARSLFGMSFFAVQNFRKIWL